MPDANDKRSDFLWLVSMFMLKNQELVGWHGFAGDAVAASYLIPTDMTARDAALQFWGFFDKGFGGEDEGRCCPAWMAGLDEPTYRG